MKRFVYVVAMLLLAACNDSGMEEQQLASNEYEFYAYVSDVASEARTYADAQQKLHWTNDDRITIFHGMLQPLQFAFMGATGAQSGTYRNVDAIFYAPDPNAPNNVAIYPYSANHQLDEQTRAVALTMPAEQTYAENSFGLNANTMIAITSDVNDLALYFKNVGTFLDVRLWGENQTVKSITITATGGEPLSGNATVTPVYNGNPTCVMSNTNVSPSVKLMCEEPVTVNTTEDAPVSFWLVLPPGPMAQGFTATVENAEGETQTFEVARSVTFQRNKHNKLTRELAIKEKTPIAPEGLVTIHNEEKGMLLVELMDYAYDEIESMKVTGTMNDEDFLWIYYEMPKLRFLDISEVDITTLPNRSFYESTNVETLILPETLVEIRSEVFVRSKLKSITIPSSVLSIGNLAFYQCTALASVTFKEGLVSIGQSAFAKCTALSEIKLPKTLTTMGQAAFANCTALASVRFASGCNLSALNREVFNQVPITSIQIPAKVTKIYSQESGSSLQPTFTCPLLATVTFEENSVLSTMGQYFSACPALESIVIPASVTEISANAFSSNYKLNTVTFEQNATLKSIRSGAFSKTDLTTISIPASCEEIANAAFSQCSELESVEFAPNAQLTTIGGYVSSNKVSDGTFYYCRKLKNVVLPASLVSLGDYAFYVCDNLPEITIPAKVVSIGSHAFYNCKALVSITFAASSKLEKIGASAFGYTPISSIALPKSLQSLGESAFFSCENLKKVTFESGSNLATIGDNAFYSCALTSIKIPAATTSIGSYAFQYNKSLTVINFEEGALLKTIGSYAFADCGTIHYFYAQNCTQLKSIQGNAFYHDDEMRLFKIGTVLPPTAYDSTFGAVGTYAVLKVPTESVAAYQAATGWKKFASITGLDE